MTYDGIIASFGEVFLKGKNRSRFIDRALRTVKGRLAGIEQLTVSKTHANLNIALNGADSEAVLDRLSTVFGIQRYQLYTYCESDMNAIKETTLAVVNALEDDGKRIKVTATRGHKQFPFKSPEIARTVGQYIAEHSDVPLDIRNPDLLVKIQVQKARTFIVSKETPGLGGLPLGINGTTLLMLSGGLDSPVAGYLMMKRGLEIEALHFDSPPYTSPRARQKVFDLAEKLAHYMPGGQLVVHVVPFTPLQKAIFGSVPESYGMTIMRRMMYRISERVAQRMGCPVLSNGESLGQVASQTPQSMLAINSVASMPVIRPVACMDKVEIMEIARRIDTYDISVRPYEDCCTVFVPKSPATAPTLKRCEQCETRFEWDALLDACVDGVESITVEAGKPLRIDADTSDEICALL
ncbi:MAG: tRNA 4-thiouridine(8) synthase ThiI [Verrucomicrobia bacterium]|jgi:tRNA uracil 4-sulfurtransferase|nr:tRNA 4-thiouridine(8) synthase ThiI [Verrucomicrobiota bacterium]